MKAKLMKRKISITGLGYVGLPVAVSFAKIASVIGYDVSVKRVQELGNNFDRTNEVSSEDLKNPQLNFTNNPDELSKQDFHIIAVPTPINLAKQPDLGPLISASQTIGKILKKGDIVVYESTVFPGATEEVCLPLLEKFSGLSAHKDFKVGYSPERINPGDKKHGFKDIVKVVSGEDLETLEIIAQVYESVVEAGVHRASSIKVAEAAKIIENTQRDVNIALMNEVALIFDKMNINTSEVLAAAQTKWNFLPFTPGLVGGHCIGVDPYYLTYKADLLGYHPEVILSGRRINDNMGKFIAGKAIKSMISQNSSIKNATVLILGLTFKENCPDIRNTKVIDIYEELKLYGVNVLICDPLANPVEVKSVFGFELTGIEDVPRCDCIIGAVKHDEFLKISKEDYSRILSDNTVGIDIKSLLPKSIFKFYWSL